MADKILVVDISSNLVKVGILSSELKLEMSIKKPVEVFDEDIDGFAKRFDMERLWSQITTSISEISARLPHDTNIIGISTCAQRIATVFIDNKGKAIYGGPNIDIRGIDSAYIIEDLFSEKDLFEITGHSPSLLFPLARLLWFKEEEESQYERISKILMLDDWIVYQLTGETVSDVTSAAESQFLDISKRNWSRELIDTFDFDPEIFPELVEVNSIVGTLKQDLVKAFNLNKKEIPIIKSGGDTQTSLLGMGAFRAGDIGITLGTTAPLQLIVDQPTFDPEYNYWTSCHSVDGKWLIEAHAGNTGAAYNWFKEAFLGGTLNEDAQVEQYLKETEPGAMSTFAYLGPENMNIKNQTSIKRGLFVFQPPQMVNKSLPKIDSFARSVIENIAFGVYENYIALKQFYDKDPIVYCAGGMVKSQEFCKILSNVLNIKLNIPQVTESAFIGAGINTLIGLKLFPNYRSIIEPLLSYNIYNNNKEISDSYKTIYNEWKNIKIKTDNL